MKHRRDVAIDGIKERRVVGHSVLEVHELHVHIVGEDRHLVSTQSVQQVPHFIHDMAEAGVGFVGVGDACGCFCADSDVLLGEAVL